MDVGAAPGQDTGLSDDERVQVIREAKELGYAAAWTNMTKDPFGLLERYWEATGLPTGTNVISTPGGATQPGQDLATLREEARRLGEKSRGSFTLGIGSGQLGNPEWRAQNGLADAKPIATMRAHIAALRPAGVPIYLAAMGPQMLRLAGQVADGALPNWMEPRHLAWARERIDEGARSAKRDPASVKLVQFIRVSVDDDEKAARHALAKNAIGYTLARPGVSGGGHYRENMTRMGLDAEMSALEALRAGGATDDEVADAFPDEVLTRLGAWGTPDQALKRTRRLAEGLDLPLIRFVLARPGMESARAILRATAPARWS